MAGNKVFQVWVEELLKISSRHGTWVAFPTSWTVWGIFAPATLGRDDEKDLESETSSLTSQRKVPGSHGVRLGQTAMPEEGLAC